MKKFMTQKIVFGLLMACVLALGVQGVASAINDITTTTAEDQYLTNPIEVTNGTFSIAVTVGLQNAEKKNDDYQLIPADHDAIKGVTGTYYYDSSKYYTNKDSPETGKSLLTSSYRISEANAHYYNEEAVTISPSSGITLYGAIQGTSSVTLRETETGSKQLTSTITLRGYATSTGKKTISISDSTSSNDLKSTDSKATKLTRTIYVVKALPEIPPTISLKGITNGFKSRVYGNNDLVIYDGDSRHYEVTYVVTGGGMLYLQEGDFTSTPAANLKTSTVAKVFLDANNSGLTETFGDGTTNVVTATVSSNSSTNTVGVYIYGQPTVTTTEPTGQSTDGSSENPGKAGTQLSNAFTVKVTDGKSSPVSGVPVTFEVKDKTAGGTLINTTVNTIVDVNNRLKIDTNGNSPTRDVGTTLYVRTGSDGTAKVDFLLGTAAGEQKVTVSVVGMTREVSAFTESAAAGKQLSVDKIRSRSGVSNTYDLYASVEENGKRITSQYNVEFTTLNGEVENTPTGNANDTEVKKGPSTTDKTDLEGIAHVVYTPASTTRTLEVVATITDSADGTGEIIDRAIFNVSGGSTTQPTQPTQPPASTFTPPFSLEKTGDNQSGETGATLSNPFVVRLRDANNTPIDDVTVSFSLSGGGSLSTSSDSTDANGIAQTTLTLPSTAGTTTVTASVSSSQVGRTITPVTFTATTEEGALPPDDLVIDGSANVVGELNTALDLSVQVVDEDNDGVSFELVIFSVTEGSGRLSPSRTRTDRDGYASTSFTPRSAGTIEVEASSGDLSSVTFTITTGNPPDAIVAVSGNNQSGKPGAKLANPFVVEVIDEDDDPVSGVSVTFAVTAGGGTLSTTNATTNANGRAQTTLTLGEAIGDNTVVARVSGLTGITFKARTGAQVLVNAAARPPMYWVDGTNGTLHRLVDAEVEDLATSAKGAMNIAIDSANGYLYWTAQTAANKGVIRRAGLNGRGVQTLKTVSTLPMGIAIDAAGGTVYWTNARGNILSMPVAGGKVTNILRNLSSPGPIAISNGVLYWGEATGSIRKMSVTAKPKTPVTLATGLGEPLAISIAKGKIYWIEAGGGGSGKLQRVNTNGKNIQQLKAFASGVPLGLTADSSENKLYWTKRTGKIQRANFAGKFVKDIVTGLPKPGSIALGVATVSTTTAAQDKQPAKTQQTQQTTQTTQTDNTQYDVNGDGAVNQADIDQVVQAVAFKSSDLKYDINGDGSVNAIDITAIVAAVNATDAAAPSVLITDIDVTLLDVTVLHEQIAVLLASGDRSIAAQGTLAYLQQLLTMARPDETVLLANYPNPFNPETWIPYHLAESTEVEVRIYDAQGTLVRALTLGHQTAGYYTSRSRAAYWDGRNALGERVASGVYFYQLQTDAISPMRKMVILK